MITLAMILMGVCAAVSVLLCALAPLGWQDEDGFHYGKPDDEKDNPP